ncbi:MAG: NAD(+)/NADH kinase [Candidatus Peribacteraceae bacterium]|nr:NAD(+)/NADH kinase [Candidatus Peribacteraceae bacterium]MDD5742852.1 NAD(+)/NADH kinase [Candidatus Peribacteraceae bacterium]
MTKYRRIGLTVKSGFDHKDEAVARILKILRKLDCVTVVDPTRMHDLPCVRECEPMNPKKKIDLLLVIGGDGTVLRAVREMRDFSVPILSVNRGTLGFLAEIELDEADHILPALLFGKGMIDARGLLQIEAVRGRKAFFSGHALNEAVIAQGTIARLIDLETTVNGDALTTYRADGLIVATPTGSTAYSLAAGGPIVHPAFDSALILTPINPYSFSQKPVIISGESRVDVSVHMKVRKFADVDVNLTIDGQMYVPLQDGDHVRCSVSKETAKFLRRKQDTFLRTLRTKLKWGE